MLFAFVWPPAVILAALVWVLYENVRAVLTARQGDRDTDRDVFYLRSAVAGLTLYWIAATLLRSLWSLSPAAYLALVSPPTLMVFIVVWGLPARLYRIRTEATRRVLERELASTVAVKEALTQSVDVDSQ